MIIYRIATQEVPRKDLTPQQTYLPDFDIDFGETALDNINENYSSILNEYYSRKRKPGSMMSWTVIPFARIKKIWQDYARTGIVNDEKGMNEIANQMITILSRIQAATDLAGHGSGNIEEWAKEMGIRHPNPKNQDFYYNFLETPYGTPVSDYGLEKLWDLARKLSRAKKAEEKILIVDQMLQITHQRGDLAALFVEGGIESLTELFLT
jgi:hypothetical protein